MLRCNNRKLGRNVDRISHLNGPLDVFMQKTLHQGDDCVTGVLQNIMTCVRKSIHFSYGEAPNPFFQEVGVKNKISFTPADQNWYLLKMRQLLLNALEQWVRSIGWSERNILHKPKNRNPISPRVVRCSIAASDSSRRIA